MLYRRKKERLWQLGTCWMMVHPSQYISKGIYPWGSTWTTQMHTIEGYAFGYTRGWIQVH